MTPILRIAIIEDTPAVQENLRAILGSAHDMSLSRLYVTAEEARDAAEEFDVMLIDVNLPGISGIDFLRHHRTRWPMAQFMMYTVHDDDARVFEALKAGANGYMLKRSSPAQLLEGIRELAAGGSPMSASIARRLVDFIRPKAPGEGLELSSREREVLSLLADGLLYKEIADGLHVAPKTVKNHIHAIYTKLHVQNRTEAVNKWFGR